ncbi:MAG: tRNA adenosine(34) deaminase TadA [Candidatus Nanopelagicales bacterium]
MRHLPTHEESMRLALAVAADAVATDDVPVGAVVLDPQGNVIGQGVNRREADHDPSAHAEIVAMRRAGQTNRNWRLDGCTLVVTLEPCAMCAGALVSARISELVFGAYDEKAGAVGSLWDLARDRRLNHRPEVIGGVLAAESTALLQGFFASQRMSGGDGPTQIDRANSGGG